MTRRPLQVAVSGGNTCSPKTRVLARALGRGLAQAGAVVICGGRGGVMAAVARGARDAGGLVVGLLPGYAHDGGNRHLSIALPTGLGHARNVLVAAAGDVLIAVAGAHGTLAEVALARVLGRPVIGLGAWDGVPGVMPARTAEEAVARALRLAARARRRSEASR